MLAGDLNQNAGRLNSKQLEKIGMIKGNGSLSPLLKMFTDEYGTMMKALAHDNWEVVDCQLKAHGKH